MAKNTVNSLEVINILANDSIFCHNWQIFCQTLGFSQSILHDLEKLEYRTPIAEIVRKIITHWTDSQPTQANLKTLAVKLRGVGCNNAAELIEEKAKEVSVEEATQSSNNLDDTNTEKRDEEIERKLHAWIKKNLNYIANSLCEIGPFMSILIEKDILTINQRIVINAKVGEDQVFNLLEVIMKKECSWEILKGALNRSGNQHIVNKIVSDLSDN